MQHIQHWSKTNILTLRAIRYWQWAAVAVLLAQVLFYFLRLSEGSKILTSNLTQIAADSLNICVAFWATRSLTNPQRPKIERFWRLLTLSLCAWLVGDLFHLLDDLGMAADLAYEGSSIAYLVAYVGMLVGALTAPTDQFVLLRRLKNLLDIGIVFLSGALVFVTVVIHPVLETHNNSISAGLPDIIFPLMDLLLFLVFTVMIFRSRSDAGQIPLVFLFGGIVLMIMVDWVMAYLTFHGFVYDTPLFELSWGVMHLLATMAGLAQVRINLLTREARTLPQTPPDPLGESWTVYISYTWIVFDIGILIWQVVIGTSLSLLLIVAWVAAVWLLVMIRQGVVLQENRQLLANYQLLQVELEQRVDQRTEELKTANLMLMGEIQKRSQLQKTLLYQMSLEGVVARVSAQFINMEAGLLHAAIDQAIGEVARFIGADRGYVFLFDDSGDLLEGVYGWHIEGARLHSEQYRDLPVKGISWLMNKLGDLKPFMVGEGGEMPPQSSLEAAFLQQQGVRSLVAAPLAFHNCLLGFLGFDLLFASHKTLSPGVSEPGSDWTMPEGDLTAFALFANALGQALERRKSDEDLRLRTGQLEALREISLEMTAQLDLTALLTLVSQWSVKLLRADAGGFFLYDEASNFLRLSVVVGNMDLPKGIVIAIGEGLTGRAFTEKSILSTRSYPDDPDAIQRYIRYFPGGVITVPVLRGPDCLGVLTITTFKPRLFSPADVNILTLFTAQAAIAIYNAQLYERTHTQAITDPLTEVYNRRHFFELAAVEIERSRRYHKQMAVMILDLDFFKRVNDTHGHLVGDAVLRQLVARCSAMLRDSDLFSRYGGEEFIALLPETDMEAGLAVAERLRATVQDTPFQVEGLELSLTISLGMTTLNEKNPDMSSLLKQADQALYIAKNTGRNRVVVC